MITDVGEEAGISRQYTVAYSPQQNGTSEEITGQS